VGIKKNKKELAKVKGNKKPFNLDSMIIFSILFVEKKCVFFNPFYCLFTVYLLFIYCLFKRNKEGFFIFFILKKFKLNNTITKQIKIFYKIR
jgi:hypothetical protein